MSENNEELPAPTGQEEMQQTQNQSSKKESSKKLKDTAKKLLKKGAAKQSLLAALGPILLWIFVGIVILIIIIGLAMFLVTMPGMVMEQLKALSKAVGNYVAAFFGADTTEQIDEIEVYGTLDYLEQMGWDLKGEGFLTDYMTESDVKEVKENLENAENARLDEKTGVVRNENDEILKANSDFIFKYLVSDNYVYTIKNNNLATHGEEDGFFKKLFSIVTTGVYKIRNFFFGDLYDVLGINDALYGRFGVGLLAIRKEDGAIGAEGNLINSNGTIWNWDSIKINTDNKKLSIAKNSILSTLVSVAQGQQPLNNPMEFNLDGWTGRYGMPLEFLMAVHKSTMMPDLAYDMVETFGTEVNILLHDIEGSAIAQYKDIGFDELNEALNGVEGSNFFSAVISWFDNLSITQKEAQIAFKMGVDHSPNCECKKGTIEVYTYDGKEVTEKDGKYYYKDGETEKEVAKEDLTVSASQSDEYVEICSECEQYVQTLISVLQTNTNYNYQAYSPYISSVKDHWYRDVYFVINKKDLSFVDYDYDYEAITHERWTLYETDEDGNFVYYKLNDDGSLGEKYNGKVQEGQKEITKNGANEIIRISSVGEDGTKVTKKALTIDANDSDKLTDLGWNNNNEKGIWSAYEEADGDTSTKEPLFPDVEDDGSYESIIKKNCYINLTTSGNIVQKGEGQRTETNKDIKKMFLQNNYFRYSGKDDTAEIITALRQKIYGDSKNRYGPISEDQLNKEYDLNFDNEKYTSDAQNGKYKVADYVGNVTLEQDGLNAFSMLENTHTLDADYIYRDFKELMVELGYYTKEELTDETPRLLQWLVPDIGSGGYPRRAIDKRENEFGTMIHSKGDIDANVKNTLAAAIEMAVEGEIADGKLDGKGGKDPTPTEGMLAAGKKFDEAVGNLNLKSNNQFTSLGAAKQSSSSLLSLEEWWESQQEMFDVFKSESWTYALDHSCATFEDARASKHTTDCSLMASWALQRVGALQEGHTFASGLGESGKLDESNACAQDLLDAGAEVIVPPGGTKFSSAANGGELEPGDVLFYEGHVSIYCGDSYDKGGTTYCWDTGSTDGIQAGGPRDTSYENRDIKLIVRLPLGNSKSPGEPYVGYEGNEAVVSPVTGILLEYGTYQDGEKDGITQEEYRTNVDLKYGPANTPMIDEEGNAIPVEDIPEDREGGEIVADKVGYAKILVLDAEHYQKLEAGTGNRWKNGGDNLVKINVTGASSPGSNKNSSVRYFDRLNTEEQMDEDNENWSALDKTVYGYKEFAETYEKAGISGHVIYIDGFVCEEPDEKLAGGEGGTEDTGSKMAEQLPEGEKLTLDSFKIKESELEEQAESEDALQSKYEQEDKYKLASKKATDKLNAESSVKAMANTAITINDSEEGDLVFIKEGTVIGRTMTDKELVTKIRKDPPHDYEYYRPDTSKDPKQPANPGNPGKPEEENQDKVIGNYIRIIMRDLDDTVVENVEDYMKLDDGEKKKQEVEFEQLAYYLGCLLESFNEEDDLGDAYGVEVLKDGAGNTTAFGLTKAVSEGKVAELYPQFASHLAAGRVPKEEAQDVFILVLEAAKETIESKANKEMDDNYMFALIDLSHASPEQCYQVIDIYNANGTLTVQDFENHWGTNENYGVLLRTRGHNRGILATEGRFLLYQEGSEGDEVLFDTETPWTDFCEGGGTFELTRESSGFYHVEKDADDYVPH